MGLAASFGTERAAVVAQRSRRASHDPRELADEVGQAVALRDPELVEAAREVDQTLFRWSLGLTPLERLCACTQATSTLER